MERRIICAYPATGKTTFYNSHKDVCVDFDRIFFYYEYGGNKSYLRRYLGFKEFPIARDYPNNFIEAIEKLPENISYVFCSINPEIIDALEGSQIEYEIVIPTKESIENGEYEQRFYKRFSERTRKLDTSLESYLVDRWKMLYKEVSEMIESGHLMYCKNVKYVTTEYLSDYLIDNNMIQKFANDCKFDKVYETSTQWVFENSKMQVFVAKSGSTIVDLNNIEQSLNEAYGSGFVSTGCNGSPYVEYKIIPLNHDLEQKTDKRAEANNSKMSYNIQIGSFVKGLSKSKGEEYTGQIIRFNRTNYNDIVTVYILARENGRIVPLDPDSVQLSSPYPKAKPNKSRMNLGNATMDKGSMIGGYSL